ncbi:MAG: NAD(P)/FAD-dependent oxidoreductase [Caldilineaceae bacterium]|nr:NAD(P)/FAD-dependent oxidoreductase [Caldilineaceae bacterium]
MSDVPRVVIVGGGFGGLYAAKKLKDEALDITLIDKENHHLFLPLLYQVAIAGLSPGDIAVPLREIFSKNKNVRTLMGKVTDIDVTNRRVIYPGDELPYDALIIATGAAYNYFGNDQWIPHAPGMDGLESALEIRRRILMAYEEAEQEQDPERQQALMTFVIIGAGPTGVELAGAIAEMANRTFKEDFRVTNPNRTRVILIEMLDRVLPPFPPDLSEKARRSLEDLGVTVRTKTRVLDITATHVLVQTEDGAEERIPCSAVMWAAGVKAAGLSKVIHERTGVELDRGGRIKVMPDLSIPHHPEIFVVGDTVYLEQGGKLLPGLAPVAMQQGEHAARQVTRRLLNGQPTQPFRYRDRGAMATIGRAAAVADLRIVRLSGFIAWVLWIFIHLMYLVGFRNRLIVFLQWLWNYLTFRRGARLIVERNAVNRD